MKRQGRLLQSYFKPPHHLIRPRQVHAPSPPFNLRFQLVYNTATIRCRSYKMWWDMHQIPAFCLPAFLPVNACLELEGWTASSGRIHRGPHVRALGSHNYIIEGGTPSLVLFFIVDGQHLSSRRLFVFLESFEQGRREEQHGDRNHKWYPCLKRRWDGRASSKWNVQGDDGRSTKKDYCNVKSKASEYLGKFAALPSGEWDA